MNLLVVWISINVIGLFMSIALTIDAWECDCDAIGFSFVNPAVIHDNVEVNWLGAWLLAIVLNILFLGIAVPYWIYKLCTVGR